MRIKKQTKVGIIVPVYNAEKYIEECFYSIVNQTYKNIEAIFVDDCSIDNSVSILQNLISENQEKSEINYKLIQHEKNSGVHITRNAGITEALKSDCDYLLLMDNDDIYIPNAVDILITFAKKYPNAEIINGSTAWIEEIYWNKLFSLPMTEKIWNIIYNDILFKNILKNHEDVLLGNEIIEYYIDNSLSVKNYGITPCGVWNALYRADFIKKHNIRFAEDLPIKEDVWFRYLCFKHAAQVILEYIPTYIYRIRQSSYSHSRDSLYKQIECSLLCFEKMLPDMENKIISHKLADWGTRWLNGWKARMETEKEKALLPRYDECLKKIRTILPPKKGVVYTCIIDNYDNLINHSYIDFNYDYVCFTNNENLLKTQHNGVWQFRKLDYDKLDAKRNSGWHKTHPHLLFPNYEESIWLDANIDVKNGCLFKNVQNNISIPVHPERDCVYEECYRVAQLGIENKETVDKMVLFLMQNNFPKNYGLNETCIVIRKHNAPKIQKINEEWWDFIQKHSKRDQCSLSFVLWKNEIKPQDISFPNPRYDGNFVFYRHR